MNCRDISREELGLPWHVDHEGLLRNQDGDLLATIYPAATGDMVFALSLANNFKYESKDTMGSEEKKKHLALAAKQYREISDTGKVTCRCGVTRVVYTQVYKCFFCGIFLCHRCMEEHIK
ncbi:MAG: hypothetical protein KAI25_16310 [Hyphomicrobiaceae bacterium]|nr:hypothetical protein [Hyphomicrobiaceae bacterium]